MYCPQCGTEAELGQRFCRSCGVNLKVVSKAVTLGEAIARGDGGPLPKIKEMIESVKIKHATEQVSHAMDEMSQRVSRGLDKRGNERDLQDALKESVQKLSKEDDERADHNQPWWANFRDKRTPEQRREDHIVKGMVSLFSGIGLMIFLYFFLAALVLKIPPEILAKLPFELDPLLKVFWLVGLLPTLSGLGRIIAGLTIKVTRPRTIEGEEKTEPALENAGRPTFTQRLAAGEELPVSVVEHTTKTLDRKAPVLRK